MLPTEPSSCHSLSPEAACSCWGNTIRNALQKRYGGIFWRHWRLRKTLSGKDYEDFINSEFRTFGIGSYVRIQSSKQNDAIPSLQDATGKGKNLRSAKILYARVIRSYRGQQCTFVSKKYRLMPFRAPSVRQHYRLSLRTAGFSCMQVLLIEMTNRHVARSKLHWYNARLIRISQAGSQEGVS